MIDDRTGLTEEQISKGIEVTEYFYDKYGIEKCKMIMGKIAIAVHSYSKEDMISIGEKIALFNGFITYDEAKKLEEDGIMKSK